MHLALVSLLGLTQLPSSTYYVVTTRLCRSPRRSIGIMHYPKQKSVRSIVVFPKDPRNFALNCGDKSGAAGTNYYKWTGVPNGVKAILTTFACCAGQGCPPSVKDGDGVKSLILW